MKPSHKKKIKKLGDVVIKGGKKSAEIIKRYGPRVQHHARAISESTMDVMMPRRTRSVVDLTRNKKPKRVLKTKRGFFLDFT